MTVAEREYDLYVHSYLNYGADAITLKLANELAKNKVDNTLENPCRLKSKSLTN